MVADGQDFSIDTSQNDQNLGTIIVQTEPLKEVATEILDELYDIGDTYEGFELVSKRFVDHSRWSVDWEYTVLYKCQNQHYNYWVSRPATESQEVPQEKMTELRAVVPVSRPVIFYIPERHVEKDEKIYGH